MNLTVSQHNKQRQSRNKFKDVKKSQQEQQAITQVVVDAATAALSRKEQMATTAGAAVTMQEYRALNELHIAQAATIAHLQMNNSHELAMHLVDAGNSNKRKHDSTTSCWKDPKPKMSKYVRFSTAGDAVPSKVLLQEMSIAEFNKSIQELYGEKAAGQLQATYIATRTESALLC